MVPHSWISLLQRQADDRRVPQYWGFSRIRAAGATAAADMISPQWADPEWPPQPMTAMLSEVMLSSIASRCSVSSSAGLAPG
jgi:hypothetical protein